MGQVLPGLLPKGLLAELIPGGASPSSQNGTQNGTQNTSQTQSLQGTTPPQLPNGAGPQASPNPNGAMPSGPPATPSSPTTPSNPASPSSPSAPSQNGSSSASTDDGGIDDAVNYAFQSTFTALGPLGVAAQGALKLLRPDASFLGGTLDLLSSGLSSLIDPSSPQGSGSSSSSSSSCSSFSSLSSSSSTNSSTTTGFTNFCSWYRVVNNYYKYRAGISLRSMSTTSKLIYFFPTSLFLFTKFNFFAAFAYYFCSINCVSLSILCYINSRIFYLSAFSMDPFCEVNL